MGDIAWPSDFATANTSSSHDALRIVFGSLMLVGALACACRCALGARKNMCLEVDMPLTGVRGGGDHNAHEPRQFANHRMGQQWRLGTPSKKLK